LSARVAVFFHHSKEISMTQIGQFTRNPSGFSGHIRTLMLSAELVIVAISPSDTEGAPDYRVHLDTEDGPEAGAGWKRTGERAGEFIALALDDPLLRQPIRANLFRDDDAGHAWSLHWNRPQKREGRD
jgi:uncharacterized protein (DUF736 family)